MADRPVRPRHRPGAKRIDPESVENPKSPAEPVKAAEPADVTDTAEVRVPAQAGPRVAPSPSQTWRLRPRGLVASEVRDRWNEAQGEFVDDPAHSVREADALASEVADALVAEVKARRAELRSTWDGADADTEALRVALRDYRSFVRQLTGDD
jgi:hypothetical protein